MEETEIVKAAAFHVSTNKEVVTHYHEGNGRVSEHRFALQSSPVDVRMT